MNKSVRPPARVFHANRPAMESPGATKAATGGRTSTRYLPATNQTVASSPPFTKRIASWSNNSLSEVVASYRANLIKSQRFKKSSSNDFSSLENEDVFASAVRNSIEVCRVAGTPYCCVTYFRKMLDTRMLN